MGASVVTAGAFILHRGSFLFQFGPDPSGERLGIVRVGGHREPGEAPMAWTGSDPAPLLAVADRTRAVRSLLYLAATADPPTPAAETRGLMLVAPALLGRLAAATLTLGDLVAMGGQVLMRTPVSYQMPLAPAYHLRILLKILEANPTIVSLEPLAW